MLFFLKFTVLIFLFAMMLLAIRESSSKKESGWNIIGMMFLVAATYVFKTMINVTWDVVTHATILLIVTIFLSEMLYRLSKELFVKVNCRRLLLTITAMALIYLILYEIVMGQVSNTIGDNLVLEVTLTLELLLSFILSIIVGLRKNKKKEKKPTQNDEKEQDS